MNQLRRKSIGTILPRLVPVVHGRFIIPARRPTEVHVLEKFETEPTPIQVVYPQARLMSNKVRTFVDECVRKLRRIKFD
jgi:DNA-binding transcriptional LysR family regulator